MSRPFQVRRFPTWIRRALNLTNTDVPSTLWSKRDTAGDYAPIVNVIDAFQGGLGVADPIVVAVQQVLAGPGPTVVDLSTGKVTVLAGATDLPVGDPNYAYIIYGLELAVTAAVTRTPFLDMIYAQPFSSDVGLRIASEPNVPGAGANPWVKIMKSSNPYFVPPGWVPFIYSNDIAVGETLVVIASLARVPAGFKPY